MLHFSFLFPVFFNPQPSFSFLVPALLFYFFLWHDFNALFFTGTSTKSVNNNYPNEKKA